MTPCCAENRREHRHLVDQTVEVFPPGFAPRTWKAQIRDISTRGMQLLVNEELLFGRQIRIRWKSHEVKGAILYRHKDDAERFRIGVELSTSCDSLLIEMLRSQSEELRNAKSLLKQQWENVNRTIGWLNLVSDALVVTSPDGTILLWNAGAQSLYGWTREEAVGRVWSELVASPEGAHAHRRKDGSSVAVTCHSTTQPETSGLPEVIVMISRPLSPRNFAPRC